MDWLWWNVPFMVAALLIAFAPLVWAMVIEDRPRRLERDVLVDLERLPVAEEAVDALRTRTPDAAGLDGGGR